MNNIAQQRCPLIPDRHQARSPALPLAHGNEPVPQVNVRPPVHNAFIESFFAQVKREEVWPKQHWIFEMHRTASTNTCISTTTRGFTVA